MNVEQSGVLFYCCSRHPSGEGAGREEGAARRHEAVQRGRGLRTAVRLQPSWEVNRGVACRDYRPEPVLQLPGSAHIHSVQITTFS